ncbi:MAG: iron-containing alcohol dehydrogenase [Clostridia bacterium]|nr:iron-containing alcohol dehydrogenase [Clostridia bacterium]
MHPIYKCYCRVFQKVFHIAIPLLPYREPALADSITDIPEICRNQQIERVLLVTDKFLRDAAGPMIACLTENGIGCSVYDGTNPNPTVDNVEEAYTLYKKEGCQALIAFGGGSSMDCAKGVGIRAARPKTPLSRLEGILKVHSRLPALFAIPTTAGTGSEVTVAAVITDPKTHHKYPINDFCLIPKYAVLDPKVTFTLPKHLTAATGMDALTHVVEAYIGRSTTKDTRADAEEAVKLVFANLETAYTDGYNEEARRNMLRASYLAGKAFTKSYVGYVHAVAHSLGGQYGTPHGLANAVILPNVLEAYGEALYKKLHRLAVLTGLCGETDSEKNGAERFIAAVRDMNRRMGIPTAISGIREEDIPVMAGHAAAEGNPLYPVPVLWGAEELERFYRQVMETERND